MASIYVDGLTTRVVALEAGIAKIAASAACQRTLNIGLSGRIEAAEKAATQTTEAFNAELNHERSRIAKLEAKVKTACDNGSEDIARLDRTNKHTGESFERIDRWQLSLSERIAALEAKDKPQLYVTSFDPVAGVAKTAEAPSRREVFMSCKAKQPAKVVQDEWLDGVYEAAKASQEKLAKKYQPVDDDDTEQLQPGDVVVYINTNTRWIVLGVDPDSNLVWAKPQDPKRWHERSVIRRAAFRLP